MKNKPKIIIVSLNGMGNAGGVERVTRYIYDILSPLYPVELITKSRFSFGMLDAYIQPVIASFRLFFCRKLMVISNGFQAFLYPADIVICHGAWLGVCRHTEASIGWGAKITILMDKISVKLAKKVLPVSNNCKNELVMLYRINNKKITVMNNFVDESIFIPLQKIDSGKIVILFCGALCKRKGFDSLLALSNYIENNNDAGNITLRIAANTGANSELFLGKKYTEVVTGLTLEQMPAFYNSGDVLFFPTLYEGFSMATLEALSCGLPVAGSNFAIMEELRKYDFCRDITEHLSNPEAVVRHCKEMARKFAGKRQDIHEIIKNDFGREQYKRKLLNIGLVR